MTSLGLVNPKKRRDIDGVGGGSMVSHPAPSLCVVAPLCDTGSASTVTPAMRLQVDLKATLFKAEEDAKRAKATGSAAPRSKVCA